MSSPYPEFPFPLPPGREPLRPAEPVTVPMVGFDGGIVRDSLAEQRRILVSGALNSESITYLVAQLMAFDGASSRDVEIMISSSGGPMSDFFPVLDVMDLMRAKVNVTAIGAVTGTALGLVAVCKGERRAAPHATFSLRLDATQSIQSTAGDIARHAEDLSRQRSSYVTALSIATGQDRDVLVEETDRGRGHTADEALAMGIVDAIARRS